MSTEQDIENMEITIQQQKALIETMDAMNRLIASPDFDMIFTKGYFEQEASRLVQLRAEPSMASDADQKAILKSIDGIGCLRQYIRTIMHFGNMAINAVEGAEEEIALAEQEVH